jgi:hypothetical protein
MEDNAKESLSSPNANFREKWTHEDHLINHRLTWLLVSQTLLFGSDGFLNQTLTHWFFCPTDAQRQHIIFLVETIPVVGRISAGLLLFGVVAALIAMGIIWYRWYRATPQGVRPDVNLFTTLAGWAAGGLLPVVFFVAWGWVQDNQNKNNLITLSEQQETKCLPMEAELRRLGTGEGRSISQLGSPAEGRTPTSIKPEDRQYATGQEKPLSGSN